MNDQEALGKILNIINFREMQIEITVRYPFISIRIAQIKKADNTKGLSKVELPDFAGGTCKLV